MTLDMAFLLSVLEFLYWILSWLSFAFFDCICIERLSVFVVLWSYSCMDIHLFICCSY
jgi:hypothetical protein